MNKLERLVLSGMFAVSALNIAAPGTSYSLTDDERLRARQKYAEKQNQSSQEEREREKTAERNREEANKRALKEREVQALEELSRRPNVVVVGPDEKEKPDTRSDLQKVKDGIKKGGDEYCEVYPLALKLYKKNKGIKQPEPSSISKLFKKKQNKVVTGDEYRDLAAITCQECFKYKRSLNPSQWGDEDYKPLDGLDEAGIDIRKKHIIYSMNKNGEKTIAKGSFIVEKDLELKCSSQGESLPRKINISDIEFYIPTAGIAGLKNGHTVNCEKDSFVFMKRKKEKINVAGFDKIKITNKRYEFGDERIIAFSEKAFAKARKELLKNGFYFAHVVKDDTEVKVPYLDRSKSFWVKHIKDEIQYEDKNYELEYRGKTPRAIAFIEINGKAVKEIPSAISGRKTGQRSFIHDYNVRSFLDIYEEGKCIYTAKPLIICIGIEKDVADIEGFCPKCRTGDLLNEKKAITYSVWSIEAGNQEQLDAFFKDPQKFVNNIIYFKNEPNNGSK